MSDAPDVLLFSGPGQSATFGQFSPTAAARLPQVAQSAVVAGYNVVTPAVAYLLTPENDAVPGSFWSGAARSWPGACLTRPGPEK